MARIALVSNTDFSLYNFRLGLILALLAEGHEIHAVCPDGKYVNNFKELGLKHHSLYVDRKGINPVNEARTLLQLCMIFRRWKFHVVHNYTPKLNIYGNIAAKIVGVPVIMNSVTGLGYVFTRGGVRKRMLRILVEVLYRFAFKFSRMVIFLNIDDKQYFEKRRLVDRSKSILIKSEGVDIVKFSRRGIPEEGIERVRQELNLSQPGKRCVTLLISRLLWDKGIREFIEAARILKVRDPEALFLLVGPVDKGNPAAVSEKFLEEVKREDVVRYLGERSDIPEILSISDIVTLPSYYREGIPRSLLEAMSMEKPIVTTLTPGCLELVQEGKNGFLVPERDSAALASAIEKLLQNEELRIEMGRCSREKVLEEFDEKMVNSKILRLYKQLLTSNLAKT